MLVKQAFGLSVLAKDSITVSKWCTNTTHPDLQTLARISKILQVNIRELLVNKNF